MSDFIINGDTLEKYQGSDAVVAVPDNVRSIGVEAFSENPDVREIMTGRGADCISEYAFIRCPNLKSVVVQGSVTAIGANTFFYCPSLETIVVPECIESISSSAIAGCENAKITGIEDKFYSREPLGKTLRKYIPDDIDAYAHVLVYQSGKMWAEAVSDAIGDPQDAKTVFDRALDLVKAEESIDGSVAACLVEFSLANAKTMGKKRIQSLHDVLEGKAAPKAKAFKVLKDDPRAAMLLSADKKNQGGNPVDDLVSKTIKWDSVSLAVKKSVKAGVRCADSNDVCSPDALVLIISEYARTAPGVRHCPSTLRTHPYWQSAKYLEKADKVAAMLDSDALSDALGALVSDDLRTTAKLCGDALWAYARYANEAHAQRLIALAEEWAAAKKSGGSRSKPDEPKRRLAHCLRGALFLNESQAAKEYFDSHGWSGAYKMKRNQ